MKSKDPIKLDSKSSFTPSVAAFFAQAKAHEEATSSLSIPEIPRTPKRSSFTDGAPNLIAKNLQKSPTRPLPVPKHATTPKTPTSSLHLGANNIKFLKDQPSTSLNSTPSTPRDSEKYAGSSFHKSPAAHTLPIPKFASNTGDSSKSNSFEDEEAHLSHSLPSSLILSNSKNKLEESQKLFKMFSASSPKKNASLPRQPKSPTKKGLSKQQSSTDRQASLKNRQSAA